MTIDEIRQHILLKRLSGEEIEPFEKEYYDKCKLIEDIQLEVKKEQIAIKKEEGKSMFGIACIVLWVLNIICFSMLCCGFHAEFTAGLVGLISCILAWASPLYLIRTGSL